MIEPDKRLNIFDKFVHRYSRLPTEVDPDYLEMLRMSKYRILDTPDTQPGKCSNCGASKNDGRKYVDFGLQVDWHGTVHLCGFCIKDIAENAGLFSAFKLKILELELEVKRLTELSLKGPDLHESVVKAFKEFEEYYANLYSLGDGSSPDLTPSVGTDETINSESESDSSEPRSESKSDDSESAVTKSANVTGRKNVRSITDLLNADE